MKYNQKYIKNVRMILCSERGGQFMLRVWVLFQVVCMYFVPVLIK